MPSFRTTVTTLSLKKQISNYNKKLSISLLMNNVIFPYKELLRGPIKKDILVTTLQNKPCSKFSIAIHITRQTTHCISLTRWSWNQGFSFVIFDLQVMLLHADDMTRYTGSFHIPLLGSCPLSIAHKISLISLARYATSVSLLCKNQFFTQITHTGPVWFRIKIIIIVLWKRLHAKFYSHIWHY